MYQRVRRGAGSAATGVGVAARESEGIVGLWRPKETSAVTGLSWGVAALSSMSGA